MAVTWQTSIVGTASSGSTSAAVDLSGRSVGELAFVVIARNNTSAPSSTPSGWALLDEIDSTYRTFLYWKVLASGDLATCTWSGYTSGKTRAVAHILSGQDSSPIAAYTHGSGTFNATANRYIDFGSLDTSAPYIAALASDYSTTVRNVSTQPSGLTERHDAGDTGSDFGLYYGDRDWTSGAYAPSASTNYLNNNATYKVGFLVGIAAAPVTAGLDPLGMSGFFGL